MTKRFIFLFAVLLIPISSLLNAQQNFTLRPYLKLGYLISAPSASDLGYVIVGGQDPDKYNDMNRLNYGVGSQFLFPFNSFSIKSFEGYFGFDIGLQKLFSSTYDPGNTGAWGYSGYTSADNKKDSEYEVAMLGLLEFQHTALPIVLQAGLGLHVVFWEWESNYSSNYSSSYNTESGSGIQLGVLVAGGLNLPITDRMKFPIMLRIDNIFRYGSEMTISASAGLSINM